MYFKYFLCPINALCDLVSKIAVYQNFVRCLFFQILTAAHWTCFTTNAVGVLLTLEMYKNHLLATKGAL